LFLDFCFDVFLNFLNKYDKEVTLCFEGLLIPFLTVEYYNKYYKKKKKNRPKTQIVIVIVSKLAENFTKNNSKYIMKCVILSLKNKILFGL
jgi:hypothetical protein